MKIEKFYACNVSRSIELHSITDARKMEIIANNLIKRFGDEDKYYYFVYVHETYPGKVIFGLQVHMMWSKGAKSLNGPCVYMGWSRCEFEADFIMNEIIKAFNGES